MLHSQLSDAKEQIDSLNKRLNKTMDVEGILNESLDKCKAEVYEMQLNNAKLLTDGRYQSERNERLEQLNNSRGWLLVCRGMGLPRMIEYWNSPILFAELMRGCSARK